MAKLEVKTVNPDDAASALPGQDRWVPGWVPAEMASAYRP